MWHLGCAILSHLVSRVCFDNDEGTLQTLWFCRLHRDSTVRSYSGEEGAAGPLSDGQIITSADLEHKGGRRLYHGYTSLTSLQQVSGNFPGHLLIL